MKILAETVDYPCRSVVIIGFYNGGAVCVLRDGSIRYYNPIKLRVVDTDFIPQEERDG